MHSLRTAGPKASSCSAPHPTICTLLEPRALRRTHPWTDMTVEPQLPPPNDSQSARWSIDGIHENGPISVNQYETTAWDQFLRWTSRQFGILGPCPKLRRTEAGRDLVCLSSTTEQGFKVQKTLGFAWGWEQIDLRAHRIHERIAYRLKRQD